MPPEFNGQERRRESSNVAIAVIEERLKHLEEKLEDLSSSIEEKLESTNSKIKSLERDRDNALRWGLMILGSAVLSMAAWIFNYITSHVK